MTKLNTAQTNLNNSAGILWEVLGHFSTRRKMQGLALVLLTVVGALLEVASIGALLPVLSFMVAPEESLLGQSWLSEWFSYIQFASVSKGFLLGATFAIAIFVSSLYRIFLLWVQVRWGNAVGHDFSVLLFSRAIAQKYEDHVCRNTSEVVAAITLKINQLVGSFVNPLVAIISSAILIIGIGSMLAWVSGPLVVVLIVSIAIAYLAISILVRKKLYANSAIISARSNEIVKHVQESFQGIREIILNGLRKSAVKHFRGLDYEFRAAQSSSVVLSQAPRFFIEAILVIALITTALVFADSSYGKIESLLPALGVMALGIQRIMPLSQIIYANFATMKSASVSLADVLELSNVEPAGDGDTSSMPEASMPFNAEIALNAVSYRYPGSAAHQLMGISLSIRKGEKLGIFGSTGSGKSTLLDIVCGLLEPTSGTITIDGASLSPRHYAAWRKKLAVVSQSMHFVDDSIQKNITFSDAPPDETRLQACIEAAQLREVTQGVPGGLATPIGERGAQLSGGQLQRLSVARALYRNSEVLIFDEATSALDNDTEAKLIEAIERFNKDLTVIVVAHRLNTLKGCDRLIRLENGRITGSGTFKEMTNPANENRY